MTNLLSVPDKQKNFQSYMVYGLIIIWSAVTGVIVFTGSLPALFIHNPINLWLAAIIPFGTILALHYYATNRLRTGLIALQRELEKQNEAEKIKGQTLHDLGEQAKELKDYKYALDIASIVSIAGVDASLRFVNENFCKISKYSSEELIGQHHSIIWSGLHSPEYFAELKMAMQDGKPCRGEFCNKAKDGILYWVDTTIVPFLDENGKVYQYLSINHDITERKKAIELFNYQFYNAPDIILIVNENFIIETINRVVPPWSTIEEVVGRDAIEVLPPESREISRAALIKCFETGEDQEFENALEFGHWVSSRMVAMIIDGKISHVMIFGSDITKRKKAEELLRKNEGMNRAMIENMTNGLVLLDSGLSYFYQSPSVKHITGYSLEDRKTKDVAELIYADDIGMVKRNMEQVVANPNQPLNFRIRIIHKLGNIVWLDGSMVNLLNNADVGAIMVHYSDITEQIEALEKLRASEERYKSIIAVSNTGAWEYHLDTGHIWYSAEYFAMIGIDRPDGMWDDTLNTNWIEKLHPDDREPCAKIFDEYLKAGSMGFYENFFRMKHENGNWVSIWSRGKRLRDTNGNLTNVCLGTHIDISERVKAEEEIKESEQRIKRITSQVPGNTYMFEIDESGHPIILFSNLGTDAINRTNDEEETQKHTKEFGERLHDEDKAKFNNVMKEAFQTQSLISFQYRIVANEDVRWRWMQAIPDKDKNGKVVWYGATSDITSLVDYIVSIEQIIFDIGHVIRRPISSMMGMTRLIVGNAFSEKDIKEISQKLYLISEEMDKFICELNLAYEQKRQNTNLNIDISKSINKRSSLFN